MRLYFRRYALPKKTLKSVKKSGGEAIIQVKGNQKTLLDNCQKATETEKLDDEYASMEKSRNRIENRKVQIFKTLNRCFENKIKQEWSKYIKIIIKVERDKKQFNTKEKRWKKSFETAYYISTKIFTARESHDAVRGHWGIENRNHCVRDISMNEDGSRIRINPDRFVRLRSFALNIMRANGVENVKNELYKNALNFNRLFEYKRFLN